ncbi:MAG: hypothetical protein ND866_23155 [Pyrinomonadaceae bacterium]|nr:hypothetical protein [Pyrinomonadaceae bacterium]
MNCQTFETVVNDLAREQMMEANARELALAHSVDCEACLLRLALERRLTSGLRAVAEEMKSVSASPRVEQELLAAFRSQTSCVPETRLLSRRRYWAMAAAAVILVALGISGIWLAFDRPSDHPSPPTAIKTDDTKTRTSGVSAVTVQHSKAEPSAKMTPPAHRPRRRPSVQRLRNTASNGNEMVAARDSNASELGSSGRSEVTTEFLPLSYVSPASLQEGGQLVRVEVPRSTMVRFGLPVNMERYSERVKADVLVSADGLARAIRFVQ